jgi:glycosyltransferase involved in cell wall biosynthesis
MPQMPHTSGRRRHATKGLVDISLVIPAYNEAENVEPLVEQCVQALAPYDGDHEIVLIDDGSTDGTRMKIRELAARVPLLRPIYHEAGRNVGCHPSELEGLKAARGDVALFLPADLQIAPSELPRFVAAAATADVVASHRVARADGLARRLLSAANNRIERLMMGLGVHDAHSSMLLNRRALDLVVPRVVSRSALIPAEILMRAERARLRVAEIEIGHHPRVAGRQTGAKPSEVLGVQLDLVKLRRRLRSEAEY